jgi:hypothetical protein
MTHRAIREQPNAVHTQACAGESHDEMQALLHKPLPPSSTPSPPWTGSALGHVVQVLDDGRCLVEAQAGGDRWHSPRAASCLLAPGVGDTVLVAGPQRDHVYLIAVITQADASRSELVVDGDVTLRSRHGGIALQAQTQIALASPALTLHAQKARLEVDDMVYRGGEVRVTTLVARFIGRTCETVLDRLSVLTRSSFRLTEEVDQVRAGQIDYQARETLRLHAKNTLVTSKALVKVDADQIHMG